MLLLRGRRGGIWSLRRVACWVVRRSRHGDWEVVLACAQLWGSFDGGKGAVGDPGFTSCIELVLRIGCEETKETVGVDSASEQWHG